MFMRFLQLMLSIMLCGTMLYAFAIKYEWGIWPRLDTAFDTRQSVGTDDGALILYPYPPEYDANGCDINAHEHFGITPVLSYIFFRVSEARVKDCELKAYFETDFTGVIDNLGSSINTTGLLKMRYAWFKACWPHTTFLVGNAKHPLYPDDCTPNCVNYNGGTPMASYARYPQFRLEHAWHDFIFGITPYSQFLFQSLGPIGFSRTYIRHSLTPGLCVTAEWKRPKVKAALLFNIWQLQPDVYTTSATDSTKKYVSNEKITSMIGSAWVSFTVGDLRINNQIIAGQNGPAFNTLGGYAVSCYNPTTGASTYANINFASVWSDWEYNKHKTCTPGFFIGFVKSLGSGNKPVYLDPTTGKPTFYGFDDDLDQVFRFAPRITTQFHRLYVGFEFDFSQAWFGPMNACGKHPCTCPVNSVRVLLQAHGEF